MTDRTLLDSMTKDPGAAFEMRPRSVGTRVRRLEDPRLLSGRARFTDDLEPRNCAHVAFRRSDHAHARILSIDVAEARSAPGVIAVCTADDLDGIAGPIRAPSRMKDYFATSMWPLARDKVRYVGEPVVAILAEDRYLAEDALELVNIEYEVLEPLVDPEAAMADDAPRLHEDAPSNVIASRTFARGDIDEALAGSPIRVSGRFRMRRKTPLAMENRACVAEWDAGRGSLTVTLATQIPGIVRDALAELLGMPGHSVRVVAPDVGGGFGGKGSLYGEEVILAALARKLDIPIKWTSDRLEDLIATSQGFDEVVDAELGLTADGAIVGLNADVVGDIGAYSIYPWTGVMEPVQVVSFMPGPYRVPTYRGHVRVVSTCKAPTGPYRGVGRPISTFVMERLMDMAAARLGLDPVEIRLRNLVRAEEFPYKVASGIVWDRSSFVESLEAACEAADYPALRREQVAARTDGRLFGIGIATYAELTGIGSRISAAPGMPINTGTETATVKIDSTGAVTANFGVASHGQGLETTLAQVLADELGARLEDIRVLHGDSALVAHGTGTYASRSAVLAGGAGTMSARAVKSKVLRIAAHLLDAPVEDLDAHDGFVHVRGANRHVSFREIAKANYSDMDGLPKELREDLSSTNTYDPFFGTATAATHIAVVELDPETYQVSLRRFLVAEDCGRIINPMIVDGQIHGAVAQGIGAALYEEVVYDPAGQMITASLADYVVPAAAEVPNIGIVHLEAELPSTFGGFRGMGEGGTIGAPAAIANALSDALSHLGVGIHDLPATPERIFRLIDNAGKAKASA